MNLYHYLAHTTNEQLTRIAHAFEVSAMSPSKRNLLHDISKKYKNPDFMHSLVQSLPDEMQGFLIGLVFFTPSQNDRLEIPPALAAEWCKQEPLQEHIETLEDKGLLFRDQKADNGQIIMPGELRAILRNLFTQNRGRLEPTDAPGISENPFAIGMIDAIFHLLAVAQHSKVSQTQKGSVHRKALERWNTRCHDSITDELTFNLAVRFSEDHELLSVQQDTYRPTHHVVNWFKQPIPLLKQQLWDYFLQHTVLRNPAWQNLLITLSSATLNNEDKRDVFSLNDLHQCLSDQHNPEEITTMMKQLAVMYAVDFDTWETPSAFSFTQEGCQWLLGFDIDPPATPEPEPCIVQPNFQLLAPPTVGYERLWYLDQLAEFQNRDVFSEFRLTQESILNAMRRGWSAEAVFRTLNEYTAARIPDNVLYSLEEWTGKYGQIHLRKTVLIECASKELADEVMHVPDVQSLIEERVSDQHFSIEPQNARKLMKLLQTRGYEPSSAKNAFE